MTAAAAAQAGGEAAVHTVATFRFLGLPELWQLALLVLPALLAFAWWSYGGLRRLEPRTRWVLSVLRGLAIAVLLAALFQPVLEQVRYSSVRTQVHVLIDDSASMQRHDTYPEEESRDELRRLAGVADLAEQSRTDLVAKVLGRPGGLLERLREQHDVRLFRFVREPRQIRDFDELTARGPRTNIGDALDLLHNSPAGPNIDAVILVSDGRSNGGLPPVEAAEKLGADDVPVFCVGVGDPNPAHNVRLVGPFGPKEALRGEQVGFDVTLSAEGLAGKSVAVTLLAGRDGGALLPRESQTAVLREDGVPVKVRMFQAFEEPGDYTLRFEVAPFPEETSQDDNVATRFLRVNNQRINVLFLEDLPRWEYRYVKNALKRADTSSIEEQAFLFDASRDFPQESSTELPSLTALPRAREELFHYDVILIGDVPPERFGATEEQRNAWLETLVEFAEFGGGVGFIWGPQAMPERYRGTPLEDLLPVVLDDRLEVSRHNLADDEEFRPRLDNPGAPHDIALLEHDPKLNERVWTEQLAPLVSYYPVLKAKAGAETILVHPKDSNAFGPRVIAAAGYYPRGRTLFVATDETWRWRFMYHDEYHDAFWRNAVRWLAGSKLQRRDERFELNLDKVTVDAGDQVRVVLRARDAEFQPSRQPEFPVFLRRPEGGAERRLLRAAPDEPGTYQGAFTLDEPGAVSVMVCENDDPAGAVLAREDVLVRLPDRELAQSSQDRAALEEIAKASKGGRYVFLAQADHLADDLRERKVYEHEVDRKTRPLWDTLWTLLTVLVVLAAEWLLRKRARLV